MEPTLLMLDEPTNHLDLNAVIWLNKYGTNALIMKPLSVHEDVWMSVLVFRTDERKGCQYQILNSVTLSLSEFLSRSLQLPPRLEEDSSYCFPRPEFPWWSLYRYCSPRQPEALLLPRELLWVSSDLWCTSDLDCCTPSSCILYKPTKSQDSMLFVS